jgi:hypothetical protein
MRPAVIAPLLLALSAVPALAQVDVKLDETNSTKLPLPAPGGWVLSPDGETLIVSSPKTAEIIYIDTSKEKEVKRVKVNFQPAALALRGTSLYAVAKGSSLLYVLDVLDAQTGQSKEQIRVPGDTLVQLACHPSAGPLFATNDQFEVLALKMGTSKLEKTEAQGNFLAVAPKGDFLYTGTQKPIKDVLVLSRGPRNSVNVGVAKTNINSTIVKYSLKAEKLEPVAMKGNAAINGRALAVSPDGQKIALVGAGGMQGKSGKRVYAIAVYDTSDLETQLGQVETGAYPSSVSFHPVLDIGVAEKFGGDRELLLFDAMSFAVIKTMAFKTRGGAASEAGLLTFGGRGTKLIYYPPGVPVAARNSPGRVGSRARSGSNQDQQGQLYLIPLELTDDQKAELAKIFPPPKG